jgi:hypothetical protein
MVNTYCLLFPLVSDVDPRVVLGANIDSAAATVI